MFDDTADVLSGARLFTKLDHWSVYWQIEMEESDKEKTAFSVSNLGHSEFSTIYFGLCNAGAVFRD